jgi:hypothetical protein
MQPPAVVHEEKLCARAQSSGIVQNKVMISNWPINPESEAAFA